MSSNLNLVIVAVLENFLLSPCQTVIVTGRAHQCPYLLSHLTMLLKFTEFWWSYSEDKTVDFLWRWYVLSCIVVQSCCLSCRMHEVAQLPFATYRHSCNNWSCSFSQLGTYQSQSSCSGQVLLSSGHCLRTMTSCSKTTVTKSSLQTFWVSAWEEKFTRYTANFKHSLYRLYDKSASLMSISTLLHHRGSVTSKALDTIAINPSYVEYLSTN